MLYGMAEPVHAAIKRLGLRLRVYAPVGELVPGHGVPRAPAAREHLERELRAPPLRRGPRPSTSWSRRPTVDEHPRAHRSRRSSPPTDADRPGAVRARAAAGVAAAVGPGRVRGGGRPGARRRRASRCPALIDGERVRTAAHDRRRSTPAQIDRVVATSASCTAADADAAVAAAVAGRARLARGARPSSGPALLFRAAAVDARSAATSWPRSRCFEAGKPWDQADADVCEAIDFCEYYGREVLRLDARRGRPGAVAARRGEPAHLPGQGRHRGHRAVELPARHPVRDDRGRARRRQPGDPQAGRADPGGRRGGWPRRSWPPALPPGVFQLLPGLGEEVGARLVEHPDVAVIAFTGSKAGRPRDQPGRGHRRSPGSATSRGSCASSAARTR